MSSQAIPNHIFGGELSLTSEKIIGDYVIGKAIGQGSYGKVKLGIHQISNLKVAIKFVSKSHLKTPKQVESLLREVKIMKYLNHPHIVKVFDVLETEEDVVVIMEYVSGGELFDYIVAHGRLKPDQARKFFRQILSAIDYCHKNSIIHRDLKPENLLVDDQDVLKITDFGFANFFVQDKLLDTFCGSPCYMPPEMIRGEPYLGHAVDSWGTGILLYSLLTGSLPFSSEQQDLPLLYSNITKARYRCPHYLQDESRDVISKLLTVDYNSRATIEDIMNHPWVCEGFGSPPYNYLPERKKIDKIDPMALGELEELHLTSTRQELEEALLKNEFGPITSSYYLIIEYFNRIKPDSPTFFGKVHHESTNSEQSFTDTETMSNGSTDSLRSGITNVVKTGGTKRSPSYDFISSMSNGNSNPNGNSNLTPILNSTPISISFSPPSSPRTRKLSLTDALPKILSFKPKLAPISSPADNDFKKVKKGVFTVKTTSTKTLTEMIEEIEHVLKRNQIEYKFSLDSRTFTCNGIKGVNENRFEIMLCHIEKLGMNGLYFRRIRGNFWTHKQLTDHLVSQMKL